MHYFIKISKNNHSQYIRVAMRASEVARWIIVLRKTFPDYQIGAVAA